MGLILILPIPSTKGLDLAHIGIKEFLEQIKISVKLQNVIISGSRRLLF